MTDDRSHAWQAHAADQAAAWARLSHLDRLRWLQSAKRFAKSAADAAARRLADGVAPAADEPARVPSREPVPG